MTLLFMTVSGVLPFVAYASDSRRLLRRYPCSAVVSWQAIAGLAGLTAALVALGVIVCFCAAASEPDCVAVASLIYWLVFPPLIIGSFGAASAMAMLAYGLICGWHRP